MPLPSAMQEKREKLLAEENPESNNSPEPKADEPVVQEPVVNDPVNPDSDTVTISKDELERLRTSSSRAAELLELERAEREALEARLTAGPDASKGSPAPDSRSAPDSAPAWDIPDETVEEELLAEHKDSVPAIRKIVLDILREVLPKNLDKLSSKLDQVQHIAAEANTTVRTESGNAFNAKVQDKVKDFSSIVTHDKWKAFLGSTDTAVGVPFNQVLQSNVARRNLEGVVRVFNKFRSLHMANSSTTDTIVEGYTGAAPSGTSGTERVPEKPETFKLSERKEMSKKFINQEITKAELDSFKERFDKADKEGRVDYNN